MSDLAFSFEENTVRVAGSPEVPLWVAQDVCRCLEIQNPSQALDSLEDDEKGISNAYTLGGNQQLLTVTEAGLYRLIFKSRKDVAKRFQRWVLHEVLPQIRKTKGYSMGESPRLQRIEQGIGLLKQLKGVPKGPGRTAIELEIAQVVSPGFTPSKSPKPSPTADPKPSLLDKVINFSKQAGWVTDRQIVQKRWCKATEARSTLSQLHEQGLGDLEKRTPKHWAWRYHGQKALDSSNSIKLPG